MPLWLFLIFLVVGCAWIAAFKIQPGYIFYLSELGKLCMWGAATIACLIIGSFRLGGCLQQDVFEIEQAEILTEQHYDESDDE